MPGRLYVRVVCLVRCAWVYCICISGLLYTRAVAIAGSAWSIVFARDLPLVYKYTQDSQETKDARKNEKNIIKGEKTVGFATGGVLVLHKRSDVTRDG